MWLQMARVAPVRVQMERDEMYAATDAARGHPLDELIAADPDRIIQPDHIQVPRMQVAVARVRGQDHRRVNQLGVISRSHPRAAALKVPDLLQLLNAERSRQVAHVVFKPRSDDLV